jgi:alanine racemase
MLAGRERALAEIDLGALRANVRRLMHDLPRGAVHCAVVKADGYGHGAVQVARAALDAGTTWLGVATVAEAEELRAAGLHAPVLIFGPMTGPEVRRAAAAGAEVVVWSDSFLAVALSFGVRVHVKFDSGMGRLGVGEDEATILCADAAQSGLLTGLMTHFATADEEDTAFYEHQLGRFTVLAGHLMERHPGLLCHAANSAATLRGPRAHFGMVRTGIAMYGLAPDNGDPGKHGLRPVMKLSSYLAGVRNFGPGESVGYGRRFIAERQVRIGIVPIGYADGVNRLLTNKGDVLVAGRRCRIAGTISMDQLTVLLPEDVGRPGDEVTFFGPAGDVAPGDLGSEAPRILCEEMAQLLGTINYEVVCRVSPRVLRRYRSETPLPEVRTPAS